jgi:AAA+ ATPase superfamily predicted ATPase
MENPFRYGSIVTGEYFVDREQERAELELDMRSGQNVVLVSPRRYGKTSLVLTVAQQLRAQGVLVAYLDLITTPSKAQLADGLATALYRDLVGFKDRTLHKITDFFTRRSLQPRFGSSPDGTLTVELGLATRTQDVDAALKQLLEIPGQIAKDQKKRVAVVLDEFQDAKLIDEHLPAVIRSVWQMQPDVSHLFLGSQRHMMQRLFTSKAEPMYRMAKPMTLEPIGHDVFARFIGSRFAATGREITDDAVERILKITGCHPHDTQELSYFSWNMAYIEQVPVTLELVERALAKVVQAENARYTEAWIGLTKTQRLILSALTASGGAVEIYSESYRQRYGLGIQSTVQSSLKGLRERDLVEVMSPGEYRIPDPFLRAWLARMTTATAFSRMAPQSAAISDEAE